MARKRPTKTAPADPAELLDLVEAAGEGPPAIEAGGGASPFFSARESDITIPKSAGPERFVLVSRVRGPLQFNLPHEICCSGTACYCATVEMMVAVRDRSTGGTALKPVSKRCAGSITVLGGRRLAVTKMQAGAPDVVAAARRGDVEIVAA